MLRNHWACKLKNIDESLKSRVGYDRCLSLDCTYYLNPGIII